MTMPDLPVSQKFALLELRAATAGKDSLAAKVLASMRAMGIDASDDDRDALVCDRYARKPPGYEWLTITPPGLWKADQVARDLARQYQIHHLVYYNAHGNHGPSVRCACGWSTFASITNEATLQRHAGDHLAAVKARTWSPPRSAAQVFDDLFSPKAAAVSRAAAPAGAAIAALQPSAAPAGISPEAGHA